jgi:D-glucosaminate-6-phosphate ammonia-lyase
MSNQSIYERLGVPTIINGKGTSTRVSGGIMPSEVADAMREATQACVDMATLQARASEIIAGCTGAEAGYVTSGAAAALLLGTAACVTGLDPGRMNRLPDTRGMRNRVIMVRSQRNLYDHAVRAAGISLIEVGIADRYSGPGVRDASAWEIADAIDEHTACVFYVAQPQSQPPLHEVVAVAHAAGVPVLVDAAAQLPPVSNLRRFIDDGADLVAFSGGKAVLGPQGSGVLCGRKDLIAAAAMNNLDHDIFWEQWTPPADFIDKNAIKGLPQHGIGRACKVGKEQVVGLMVALQMFDEAEVARRNAQSTKRLDELETALGAHLPIVCERTNVAASGEPRLRLALTDSAKLSALELVIALQNGEPPIQLDPFEAHRGIVTVVPAALRAGEGVTIAGRITALLS